MTPYRNKKIVIVGAGISGLSCALGLKELGFDNVCLLEARNRIGGRIHTIEFNPHFIEMGAHWIHGQEKNIIYEIAKSNNFIDEKAIDYLDSIMCFNHQSKENREIIRSLIEYLDNKLSEPSIEENTDYSTFSYLKEQFDIYMTNYLQSSKKNLLHEAFNWYCKFECEINGCCNLKLLSKKLLSSYKECDGSQNVEMKHGYQSILNLFLQNIPNDWILKNHVVIEIDWSGLTYNQDSLSTSENLKKDKMIKIVCENGKEYFADHVIITLPLGILKKCNRSLFNPCLSLKKQLAISCLGFDVVNKIFLHFDNPFWKKSEVINVIWHKEFDSYFPAEHYLKNPDPLQHWVKSINRFAYTHGHPNMLCVWVIGEGASTLEFLPDDKVENDCRKLLELLVHEEIPKPSKLLRSAWSSDPFSLGSYSYLSMECEINGVSHIDIAEPEYSDSSSKYPVLLFAGEASHESHFSTVHGACESGLREAKRLKQFYSAPLLNFEEVYFSDMAKVLSHKNSLRQNMKIIIIGAGIAGLSCASQLIANNFSQVYVLEAQNRLGGRIQSIAYDNKFLELGAQWIHGTDNELYKFSKYHGILPPVMDILTTEGEGKFYTSSGDVIDNKIVEEVKKVLNQTKSNLEKSQYDSVCQKSVYNIFSETFESYLEESRDKLNVSLRRGLFDWYIKFEVIDNACDSLSSVASQSYAEWDDCPPDLYHISTIKGFESIIDTLCKRINEQNLFLNKPVSSIKWCENFKQKNLSTLYLNSRDNDTYPVYLKCEDGTAFTADCVIVTASIGFLKENCDSFFSPSLPLNKKRAFENIGFGTINKIFLIYDDVFWSLNDQGFQLVWIEELNEKAQKLLKKNAWIKGITGFDVVKQLPNVLLCWIGGEEAKLYEKVTDDQVSYVCTELLKLFCNRTDIPSPVKILRSQWFLNPYMRGAYSNRTLKFYQFESSLNDLQHPLNSTYVTKQGIEVEWPIVLFAGEAFDEHSFSSAHGAFRSGLKTAEFLINSFSKIEWL